MFCQVMVLAAELAVLIVIVTVEPFAANVAPNVPLLVTPLMFPVPVTFTVTVAFVLNRKPLGAVKMIVPVPMSPELLSAATRPVKVVQEPPVLSAEMAEPPVAAVTVTLLAAQAFPAQRRTSANPKI